MLLVLTTAAIVWPGTAPRTAEAHHLMCGVKAERRTQYVSIDPALALTSGLSGEDVIAAFQPWNDLFSKYYGFPVFAEHYGNWWEADILITAGSDRTWVATRCIQSFEQRGANIAIVFVGRDDAWRNQKLIVHELGHTLGLADHGDHASMASGHLAFAVCDLSYVGVMSYCAGSQTWFLDYALPGTVLDGQLIASYW